ncbi:MAG: YHYH protein [Byssovorax sp.]
MVEAQDPPTQLRTVPGGTSMTKAGKNKLWMCPRPGLAPTYTASDTPWLDGTTITISKLAVVGGSVKWDSQFTMSTTPTDRVLVGNGLPNHATGTYPIEKGTDAYDYYAALPAMGYDNAAEIPIGPYEINLTLPRDPKPNATPSCVLWIFQGVVSQTGGVWHAEIAPDASLEIHDPISALPLDECWGHPYNTQYHYHAYSWKCFPNQGTSGQHSPLFGYAIDGFGVYGPRGENGELVTNDDLDECHGHTHEIEWDGVKKSMYHYHTNNQFPYTIGCYRGTPIELPHHLEH